MSDHRGDLAGVRVGVDLDGVCCDYLAYLASFLASTGRAGPLPSPTDYHLREWFDTEADRRAAHAAAVAAGLHRDAPAIPGAATGIARLRRIGAAVVAVSARGSHGENPDLLHTDIAQWAASHDIDFDDIHLGRPKSRANCHVYIDDSPDDIAALRAAGQFAVVFDQPWNRHIAPPRVTGWRNLPALITAAVSCRGTSHR
jgi:beta-phosphoglucomutase-like phosphatase (HAD superfamily)